MKFSFRFHSLDLQKKNIYKKFTNLVFTFKNNFSSFVIFEFAFSVWIFSEKQKQSLLKEFTPIAVFRYLYNSGN